MGILISVQQLSKAWGSRTLFDGLTFGLFEGERTGLIGPNGAGKSTLLRILAGEEKSDRGTLSMRRGLRMALVKQKEDDSILRPDLTVRAFLTDIVDALHLADYEKERRLETALEAAQFADADRPLGELSGGWRKRAAILAGVLADPELLLLDEPSNHMDLEGVLWLEVFLKAWKGAFAVVTHDRYFLERVCNRVIEIDRRHAEGHFSSQGSYRQFLEKRLELMAARQAQEASLSNSVRREMEWLARGAKARSTKQQARIKRAGESIEALEDLKSSNRSGVSARIELGGSGRRTKELAELRQVEKRMGGKKLFGPLDLVLRPGERLGLLGTNGSGKSTLLRLLSGALKADAGEVRHADQLKIVLFDQHRETLDLNATLRESLCPGGDQVHFRNQVVHVTAWCKRFLFSLDQLELPLHRLSGGEQARVLIARLMLQPADLLLLDEPTNDLDLATLEVLEQNLMDFTGALVLVTHDRYLLDRVSQRILALDGRGNADFFADYAQWEAQYESPSERESDAPRAVEAPPAANPARGALSSSERNELKNIEGKIANAEELARAARVALHDPSVASDAAELMARQVKLDAAQAAVDSLLERWDYLEKKKAGG